MFKNKAKIENKENFEKTREGEGEGNLGEGKGEVDEAVGRGARVRGRGRERKSAEIQGCRVLEKSLVLRNLHHTLRNRGPYLFRHWWERGHGSLFSCNIPQRSSSIWEHSGVVTEVDDLAWQWSHITTPSSLPFTYSLTLSILSIFI